MEPEKITGKTKNSGFQIGVRRTFGIDPHKAWQFLVSEQGQSIWLGKITSDELEPNKTFLTKEGIEGKMNLIKCYSHMRLTWKKKGWQNVSALQIRVIDAKNKTTISFHQDKLTDSEQREEMRVYWDQVLDKIGKQIITYTEAL